MLLSSEHFNQLANHAVRAGSTQFNETEVLCKTCGNQVPYTDGTVELLVSATTGGVWCQSCVNKNKEGNRAPTLELEKFTADDIDCSVFCGEVVCFRILHVTKIV